MRRWAPRRTLASPSGQDRPVGALGWSVVRTCGRSFIVQEAEPGLADEALVAATAEAMGLPARKVRTAVRYYAAYRQDINDRITANREAAQEAEAAWHAEQNMLRGNDRAS
ncbi:MAG: hypothetical protein ACRDRU_16670 [Pseudonocardiaceae bacterium]